MKRLPRELRIPVALSGIIVTAVVMLVVASLRQPELPSFTPTPPQPGEVGARLDGPRIYTLDARAESEWRYFDFSMGSEVVDPRPTEWDLAFRRFHVIANGGAGFFGSAGVRDLGLVSFDSVDQVPSDGYVTTEAGRDSVNAAVGRWYTYSWSSHVLTPRSNVYAVRTADGRFARVRFVSYYCPGATPGCVTIEYAYQGDGTTRVGGGIPSEPGPP